MEKITLDTYKICKLNNWEKVIYRVNEIRAKEWIKWMFWKKEVLVTNILNDIEEIIDFDLLENIWILKYWYKTLEEVMEQYNKLDK